MSGANFDNILAIDTASKKMILGLAYGADRMVKSDCIVERSHGQLIFKKIDELFASANLTPEDLSAVLISVGPGSFTGLRIGLAAAKGIAASMNIPILGISLFDLAAYKLQSYSSVCHIIIPSRKGELYIASCKQGVIAKSGIAVISVADLAARVGGERIVGIGFDSKNRAPGITIDPGEGMLEYDGGDLITLGRSRLTKGEMSDPAALEPEYLQKSIMESRFDQRQEREK